ncbi:MgtC/SapB family protein [Clostridium sp.]|uniref:MgtC/SapB family protein n=1 Tax=Clostridium sp. TaxID=1506 RepID=UPI002FCB2550
MDFQQIFLRLILATIIGGAVGYERGFKHRPAGLRTHMLVCLGATIVALIQEATLIRTIEFVTSNSVLADAVKIDLNRLGAQVITGVGFLGAGTILHDRGSIKGLTTAATLWVVACIGLGIGSGYITISIFGGLFTVLVLVIFKKLESRFMEKETIVIIEIVHSNREKTMEALSKIFGNKNITVNSIESIKYEDVTSQADKYISFYTITFTKHIEIKNIIQEIVMLETIYKVTTK